MVNLFINIIYHHIKLNSILVLGKIPFIPHCPVPSAFFTKNISNIKSIKNFIKLFPLKYFLQSILRPQTIWLIFSEIAREDDTLFYVILYAGHVYLIAEPPPLNNPEIEEKTFLPWFKMSCDLSITVSYFKHAKISATNSPVSMHIYIFFLVYVSYA